MQGSGGLVDPSTLSNVADFVGWAGAIVSGHRFEGVAVKRVLVVAVLLLAGCGGGGGESSSAPKSASDVASLIGCTGFKTDPGGQMYAKEVGSCQLDGGDVYVQVFADDKQRDQWLEVAKTAGGGGSFVQGPGWTVQVFTNDTAAKVAKASGGTVVD